MGEWARVKATNILDSYAVSKDSKYQALKQRQKPWHEKHKPHVHMICLGSNQVYCQMSPIDKEDTTNTKVPWLETGLDLVYAGTVVLRGS